MSRRKEELYFIEERKTLAKKREFFQCPLIKGVESDMKILYVTDLHGDKKKYSKILEVAIEKEIKVIVNGGDMLPKKCDRHSEQPFFINGFLYEYFEELKKQDITYLAMLGNDDLLAADKMFDNLCNRFENVCNMAGRKVSVNGYEFIGMNYILDHPFGCKDRVVTETHYIPQQSVKFL